MRRTGQLDLPLHTGRAPRWLFERMVSLGRCISEAIIIEQGKEYFLKQLSDPMWFQSLGCVLGFDWHSSGLTTTVCGALKEAFKELTGYGVYFCGGKGATSRKTPQEIKTVAQNLCCDPQALVYASKVTAKVDNNALQDGFTLYHHSFVFTDEFEWVVVQQGMSGQSSWSRRYHWYSQGLGSFVNEPHKGIVSAKSFFTLNLVDKESGSLRDLVAQLAGRRKGENMKEIVSLQEKCSSLPSRHRVLIEDINPKYLDKIFLKTYARKPEDFQTLLSEEGVGAKTLRALALISDLIYGAPVSFRDPVRFSFAHGGKDGHPYRIKRQDYDKSIEVLSKAVHKAGVERAEKMKAFRRLHTFYGNREAGVHG